MALILPPERKIVLLLHGTALPRQRFLTLAR